MEMKRMNFPKLTVMLLIFIVMHINIASSQSILDDLSTTVDFTYGSKYMWHGFDVFDDHGAFQPSVTVQYKDLYVGVWASLPDSNGFEDLQELDYYIGYDHSFLEDERYAIDVSILYTYFDFPKDSSAEAQEFGFGFSMPQLIPVGDSFLVPSYMAYFNTEGFSSNNSTEDGWFHDFGLSYSYTLPATPITQEEQTLDLEWMITYNDGAYGTDAGFSHTVVSMSTTWEWNVFYFSPMIAYQWSFEDTVNTEDEFYALIRTGVSF
jgi:hypothetical protein